MTEAGCAHSCGLANYIARQSADSTLRENLLSRGYPEPFKPPRLFRQMLIEFGDLKHRGLRCITAHLFGSLAG